MRIAIDARYIREKPSGIGTYVQAIIDRLPLEAPLDQFLFWAHPLAVRPLSTAPNTREITVKPGPNSPWPLLWPARYASLDDMDLFHGPHNLLPRGIRCPTVVTLHDVMSIDRPDLHLQGLERLAKSAYYPRAVWRALRRATRLIVPTAATADRVRALCPEASARTHVIWEAADAGFRPADDPGDARKRAFALTGIEEPYLLVLGADSRAKRHAVALSAFAAAAPPPWRLVLLERPAARHHAESQRRLRALAVSLGVDDRVVWLTNVERPDVVVLLQAAGTLLQPSVYEGFGLPVVEAMACGCPVIGTDIPPFREITAGAALLVPPNDIGALASAIRALVDSPDRRRSMSACGLARARDFSWDRCARETLAVYRDAAS